MIREIVQFFYDLRSSVRIERFLSQVKNSKRKSILHYQETYLIDICNAAFIKGFITYKDAAEYLNTTLGKLQYQRQKFGINYIFLNNTYYLLAKKSDLQDGLLTVANLHLLCKKHIKETFSDYLKEFRLDESGRSQQLRTRQKRLSRKD